jgi:hypothetical protein
LIGRLREPVFLFIVAVPMKLVVQFIPVALFAFALSFSFVASAAEEPKFGPPTIQLKKQPLKLRTVEAVPGKQPESGPPVGGVSLSVLDGESATRSKTLWTAVTDERGTAIWPQPIPTMENDPASPYKRLFVRASKPGYQGATRPIDPAAGEETIALSKWAPWMVRAIDAETKRPIPTFTVMNRLLANPAIHYGPTTARNGEALAGFFSERTIRPRQLTIEAPGYEIFRVELTPQLGATNTYELRRKPAAP